MCPAPSTTCSTAARRSAAPCSESGSTRPPCPRAAWPRGRTRASTAAASSAGIPAGSPDRRPGPVSIEPMRHNSCTVIVLASPVPPEVLATVDRSLNVTLLRPAEPDGAAGTDGPTAAAAALRRASSATSPYALVTTDPLAAVAEGWQDMWDLARPQGPARFEQEAATALAAWRAGRFELPDYYLVTATEPADDHEQNFYLGPLRAARSHRVAFVPAAEP